MGGVSSDGRGCIVVWAWKSVSAFLSRSVCHESADTSISLKDQPHVQKRPSGENDVRDGGLKLESAKTSE